MYTELYTISMAAPPIIILSGKFTRGSVAADRTHMYLFTDNCQRTSAPHATHDNIDATSWYYRKYKCDARAGPLHYGTLHNPTTAVIRGLANAYPISTMRAYGINWKESEFSQFAEVIDDEIAQIIRDMPGFAGICIGNFRIGCGGLHARLPRRLQDYLDMSLSTIGINNTGELPRAIVI